MSDKLQSFMHRRAFLAGLIATATTLGVANKLGIKDDTLVISGSAQQDLFVTVHGWMLEQDKLVMRSERIMLSGSQNYTRTKFHHITKLEPA